MDRLQEQATNQELFQAQSHVYKHFFNFINSMSLVCALELGIPDAFQNHNHPITLHQLVSLLKLPTNKTDHLHRLMSLLVHNNFYFVQNFNDNGEEKEGYSPTLSSKLLVKEEILSIYPAVQLMTHSVMLTPLQFMGKWFRGHEATPFEVAHGISLWEFTEKNSDFKKLFHEAMASDCQMFASSIKGAREIFEGVGSIVDVGGGTGNFSKDILEAFPQLTCTVFDLPHVVADLPESENVKFVGGDMFQSIPSADAILFKLVLHDWCDEDCIKILKRCRESIQIKDGKPGKVIIIDAVINSEKDVDDLTEIKLIFDIVMMVNVGGKERNEKEWAKLFIDAGFNHYKITPVLGFKSFIEVFP